MIMDRDIKFRAFNTTSKVMLSIFDSTSQTEWYLPNMKDECCVYMQFTGLEDKNGMDLYESDIIEDNVGRIWVIEWSDKLASFVFSWAKDRSQRQPYSRFNSQQRPFRKLGDIHANPDLLT